MIKEIAALTALSALGTLSAAVPEITPLKEDFQVIQRDAHDQGSCLVRIPPQMPRAAAFRIKVVDKDGKTVQSGEAALKNLGGDGKGITIEKLPVGGPYTITISPKDLPGDKPLVYRHILVGDLWLLGGQSNMFGADAIKEKLPTLPYLNMLNPVHILPEAHWCAGTPPIHRIPDVFAPHTLKFHQPGITEDRIKKILADKTPVGSIDCSYFFARKLYAESKVPIGLIPCAMGGALALWDPKERDKNRYGFVERHVKSAGGRIKGILFFQGEQDAIFGDEQRTVTKPSLIYPIRTYAQQFKTFVEAARKDFQNPEMPVILAQICRHHGGQKDRDQGWEIIRESQRRIPEVLPHAHCIPSVDLDLVDGLHLDYDSMKRVGERMAFLALPYVKKGVEKRNEIKLKSVTFDKDLPFRSVLHVDFTGVTGKLRAPGKPTGFCLKKKPDGEVLNYLFKVAFDPANPSRVVLETTQWKGLYLYYGAGSVPYVNIVDDNDMAVPAFGPIELK
jgi:sialate O-acetylesterase